MGTSSEASPRTRIRHGRQFHNTGSNYGLPNDEGEHKRLNYQHEAMKIMLGSNYTAPLSTLNAGHGPQSILDVASGSGQWVLEIAQEFPGAKVIGIDLSDPGLSHSVVPPNASFMIGDITNPLPFDSSSFDVVQMRVVPSIQSRTSIYKEIHRVLRTGGLILLVEPGENASSIGVNPPMLNKINDALSSLGHIGATRSSDITTSTKGSWSIATRIESDLRNSPSMWTNVHEKKVTIPIGVWTKNQSGREAGKFLQHCTTELVKGFRPALIDEGVLSGDKVDEMITQLAQELEDGTRWKLESPYHFAWAEKTSGAML